MGLGRRAFGVDASPLGVAIARVRTTLLGEARAASGWWRSGPAVAEQSGERARKRRRPDVPYWATKEVARFHPHVPVRAAGAARAGDGASRGRYRARAAPVPVVAAGQVHEGGADGAARRRGEAHRARGPVAHARRSGRGAGARSGGAGAAHAGRHRRAGDLGGGRARAADGGGQRGAGAVVAAVRRDLRLRRHPRRAVPVAGAVAEEVPARAARRPDGARRRRVGRPPGARSRPASWRRSPASCDPGGRALLVVGDGVVDGRAENAPDGIAAAGSAVGLEAVARASQARPFTTAGWRRSSPIARAASTCCCCRRASRSAPAARRTGRCRS